MYSYMETQKQKRRYELDQKLTPIAFYLMVALFIVSLFICL